VSTVLIQLFFNKFDKTKNKQSRDKSSFQVEIFKNFPKFEVSLEKGSLTRMIMKTRIFAYSHDQ